MRVFGIDKSLALTLNVEHRINGSIKSDFNGFISSIWAKINPYTKIQKVTTMTTSTAPQRYIPYSSWDGEAFWIQAEAWGRDFPAWQEAEQFGAFKLSAEEDSLACKLHESGEGYYGQELI